MVGQYWKMSCLNLNFLLSIKIYTYSTASGTLQSKLFYASPILSSPPRYTEANKVAVTQPCRATQPPQQKPDLLLIFLCFVFSSPDRDTLPECSLGSDVILVIIIHSNVLLSRCPPAPVRSRTEAVKVKSAEVRVEWRSGWW